MDTNTATAYASGPASGTYQSPYNNHQPSLEPVDQSHANGHLSQSRDTSPPTAQQSPANLESPTAHSTPDRSGPEPGALQENGGPNQTPNGQLPAQSALDPSSPLKRTYSGTMEEPRESMEKRQKIGETQDAPADFDFNALLANAAAVGAQQLAQQLEQSSTNGANSLSSSITVGRTSSEPITTGGVEAPAANTTMTRAASSTGRLDQTQILSLIFLESLATQILARLAEGADAPIQQTLELVTVPDSEFGQEFSALRSLFETTRSLYSREEIILSPSELGIHESHSQAVIWKANLASFALAIFSGRADHFETLNTTILDILAPTFQDLEHTAATLILNFKSQLYLSKMESVRATVDDEEELSRQKEEILESLFPYTFDDTVMSRHPGVGLATVEMQLLENASNRRQCLQDGVLETDPSAVPLEAHDWGQFLHSILLYFKEIFEPHLAPFLRKNKINVGNLNNSSNQLSLYEAGGINHHDEGSLAAYQAAQRAMGSVQAQNFNTGQHISLNTQGQPSYSEHQFAANTDGSAPPNQTVPTHVLYERARQLHATKSAGQHRRMGAPSQRRPWSQEEEQALMAGLDTVKGPHWSQILNLYGPEGTVNDILKDRNQVQLKDKARNLKLFFLKSEMEVPYYLQAVTGDLKTRAPSQAARKAADERERLSTGEDRAHFEGIMALGGLKDGATNGERVRRTPDRVNSSDVLSPEQLQVVEPRQAQQGFSAVNVVQPAQQPQQGFSAVNAVQPAQQPQQGFSAVNVIQQAPQTQPQREQSELWEQNAARMLQVGIQSHDGLPEMTNTHETKV